MSGSTEGNVMPTSVYLNCEGREIHVTQWGAPSGTGHMPTVIAWHGLARTGRDMDWIARHLSGKGWRVICPDTIGRGLSQWSPDPAAEYCLAFYEKLAASLLDQMGIGRCMWLGTSMGGAIGLRGAASRLRGRIERLILNDIGAEVAAAAVERIRTYAGNPPAFASVTELEAYFRTIYKPYGWLSDEHWRVLTETSTRRLPDGRVTPHYDPAMVQQFVHHPNDYDQWPAWDAIDIPVLVMRGEDSDLLEPNVARAMTQRGPRARLVEVGGCGHAPALNTIDHYRIVESFLSAP